VNTNTQLASEKSVCLTLSFQVLAAYSSIFKLVCISTVSGNQTIEKTTLNTLNVLNLIGLLNDSSDKPPLDFPLIQGAAKPLMRPGVICDEIHGESGLETHSSLKFPEIPEAATGHVASLNAQDIHYTTLMHRYLKQAETAVTLIATGPLTNVALLLTNHPESAEKISRIVLMGGAIGKNNINKK